MNDNFESLSENEVVLLESNVLQAFKLNGNSFAHSTMTCGHIILALERIIDLSRDYKKILFYDGLDCETLRFNSEDWQPGKLRIKFSLEFCPAQLETEKISEEITETESSLDDIRRMINHANS